MDDNGIKIKNHSLTATKQVSWCFGANIPRSSKQRVQAQIHQKNVKHAFLKKSCYIMKYIQDSMAQSLNVVIRSILFLYWNEYPRSSINFQIPINLCDLHFVAYSFCMQGLANMR